MKLSQYHIVTPKLFDHEYSDWIRVVFATRTAEAIVINEAAWETISKGAFAELPNKLLQELQSIELLVSEDDDELGSVMTRHKNAIRDSDILPIAIQPTASCQFGCDYCGQQHNNAWLSHSDQQALAFRVRIKLQENNYRHLHISWFGGEPLSGINVIRELTSKLKAEADTALCSYASTITTNAYALTPIVADELIHSYHVEQFNITIDGSSEYHDNRRHLKSGGKTFDRVFQNMLSLAHSAPDHVRIAVRANVDSRNIAGVMPLLRLIAEAGIQKRVSFYVAPVHSWGNNADNLSLSSADFATRELEWLAEMHELEFRFGILPNLKPVVCLAVQPEGELVDAYGTLFNCTEVSYVPTYGSPNIWALGTLVTGETNTTRSILSDFNEHVVSRKLPCADCRMLPVCGGACPKSWLEGHEPCPSTKLNIEGRLLLAYATSRLALSK
jgi:uncharacterized protein